MFSPSLPATLLLAWAVSASPVITVNDAYITLPISRRLNLANVVNLYQHDLARANALNGRQTGRVAYKLASTPAEDKAVSYIASVGIGSPATQCKCW